MRVSCSLQHGELSQDEGSLKSLKSLGILILPGGTT